MSIVSEVRLIVDYRPEAPERVTQQWKEGLILNAERINAKRKAQIPDSTAFVDKLATPAILAYASYVNPAFMSKSGLNAGQIRANHGANLKTAFRKYNDQMDFLFATVDGIPAKRFKELVERGAADYSRGVASVLLPFTGCRIEGLGLSSIAGRWLTGDVTTEGKLRTGDSIIGGGPYLICPHAKKPGLKTLLNQRLIQAGVNIVKAAHDASVIAMENQLTAEQIQGFTDPALDLIPFVAGGDSHVDYIITDGQLYLSVKVSKM